VPARTVRFGSYGEIRKLVFYPICVTQGRMAASLQFHVIIMRTLMLLFTLAGALHADFSTGLKAYQAGNYAAAAENWQPLAEEGAPHAQYNMGLLYSRGNGVQKDLAKAAHWYRLAAAQGVVEAQFNLGLLCLEGEGVPRDLEEARKWFMKAAEQGDPKAANALANLSQDRDPKLQDNSEALKWYQKAAAAGIVSAQFELGVMYDLRAPSTSLISNSKRKLKIWLANGLRRILRPHHQLPPLRVRGINRRLNLLTCTGGRGSLLKKNGLHDHPFRCMSDVLKRITRHQM
jgi:hypothetical protein